ncbi:hypothetical protein COR50_21010 [Chitinophaga caeni]|uniref:RNA polymerase subunit sigma-24 n=1 Tax=Chitinophaga caeni TaxID=2029983 RepID=A0A291QZP2_9BACT|nr:sigma-70 family RNA polymerase sigma factor [Chitinophaga caeni]ATL49456.1 hypothetical protein COR50_21010 [Chitinophaga caeni]
MRCRKGDVAAFKELYEAYSKAMFNICLRMVSNVADAEDVLQEAFTQVFKNIGKLNDAATAPAWIKRIVVNQCLNHLRKKKVYFEEVDQNDTMPEDDGVDEAWHAATVNYVKEAIEALPQGYKAVVNLYLFEDYTHKEIANFLGITESTAKTQYMRAKEKIRQFVKEKTITL